jgi:hypothetical protein
MSVIVVTIPVAAVIKLSSKLSVKHNKYKHDQQEKCHEGNSVANGSLKDSDLSVEVVRNLEIENPLQEIPDE